MITAARAMASSVRAACWLALSTRSPSVVHDCTVSHHTSSTLRGTTISVFVSFRCGLSFRMYASARMAVIVFPDPTSWMQIWLALRLDHASSGRHRPISRCAAITWCVNSLRLCPLASRIFRMPWLSPLLSAHIFFVKRATAWRAQRLSSSLRSENRTCFTMAVFVSPFLAKSCRWAPS